MKTIIIDNYDSFTYNLSQLIEELGVEVEVVRNDRFEMDYLARFDNIVLSPYPGIPSEAGLLLDVIKAYAGKKPILGVCLGHQAIGEAFGSKLLNLSEVFHGVQTPVDIVADDSLFAGMEKEIMVGRYHSWVIDADHLSPDLEVTAVSKEGQIMAVRHRCFDIHGIQFHPESVLTPEGRRMVKNFLNV